MAVDVSKMSRKQIQALRNKLDTRETEMRKKDLADLRKRIQDMVKKEGYTMDEVLGRRTRRAKRTGKVPPKYANPADPEQTWSGRGKRPNWFKAAVAKGKKEADMLIKK